MTSRLVSKGAVNVFLLIAAVYTLLPLTWLLFASTKSLSDLYSTPGFAFADLNLGANLSAVAAEGDGIFFRTDILFPMQLTHITDGTSNTFMIGEDVPEMSAWCAWPYANHTTGTCAIPLNTNMDKRYGVANGEDGRWPNTYSFRSRHAQGANFCMADGSVRFVRQSIPIATYRALSTAIGGEVVSNE